MLTARKSAFLIPLSVLASAALLSGCVGTSTYGTGKTQEAQLFQDLGGMVMLSPRERKKPIDYSARPNLVKPASVDTLPTPAETDESGDAYFPTDTEERIAALRAKAEDGDEAAQQELIEEARARNESVGTVPIRSRSHYANRDYYPEEEPSAEKRAAFLKRRAELNGVTGRGPRRYLTEPKQQYRQPYESAPVGDPGIPESSKEFKKKQGGFLSRINPFD